MTTIDWNSNVETRKQKSVVDSPWYWVYVFGAAALAALIIMGPKFAKRQTIDERNYQGRQRANQQAMGQEITTDLSEEDNRIITLQPLFIVIGVLVVLAWGIVWWQVFGRRWSSTSTDSTDSTAKSVDGSAL